GAGDCEYRAAGRADCRSSPSQTARAHRARYEKGDQDQVVEIPRFQVQETGDNRRAKAGRQLFATLAGLRGKRGRHIVHETFWSRRPPSGTPPEAIGKNMADKPPHRLWPGDECG